MMPSHPEGKCCHNSGELFLGKELGSAYLSPAAIPILATRSLIHSYVEFMLLAYSS